MRRAANNHGIAGANANSTDDAARAIKPPTSGSRRPARSEIDPIGIETANNVTPNDANSKPITVGDAPNCRLRCGRTGTAIEYARMSVKTARVTSATDRPRELRTETITGH